MKKTKQTQFWRLELISFLLFSNFHDSFLFQSFLVQYLQKFHIQDIVYFIPKKTNSKETKSMLKRILMMPLNVLVQVQTQEKFIINDNKPKLFLVTEDSCNFDLSLVRKGSF